MTNGCLNLKREYSNLPVHLSAVTFNNVELKVLPYFVARGAVDGVRDVIRKLDSQRSGGLLCDLAVFVNRHTLPLQSVEDRTES